MLCYDFCYSIWSKKLYLMSEDDLLVHASLEGEQLLLDEFVVVT